MKQNLMCQDEISAIKYGIPSSAPDYSLTPALAMPENINGTGFFHPYLNAPDL
jgi:hypothetical protein